MNIGQGFVYNGDLIKADRLYCIICSFISCTFTEPPKYDNTWDKFDDLDTLIEQKREPCGSIQYPDLVSFQVLQKFLGG